MRQIVDEMSGCPGVEFPRGTDTLRITENAPAIASALFAVFGIAWL